MGQEVPAGSNEISLPPDARSRKLSKRRVKAVNSRVRSLLLSHSRLLRTVLEMALN